MKFSSISTMRSSASVLVLAGAVFLGAAGIANAQGNSSSGNSKESPADYSDKKDRIKGRTGEGYGGTHPTSREEARRAQTKPGDYSDKANPIEGHTGEGYGGTHPGTPDEAKRAQTKPGDYSDKADPIEGHTGEYRASSGEKGKEGAAKPRAQKEKYYGMPKNKEEMDMGYADQKKRDERAVDPRSPSPDPHVQDFPRDKKGRPMKDLKDEQGGPIGPN